MVGSCPPVWGSLNSHREAVPSRNECAPCCGHGALFGLPLRASKDGRSGEATPARVGEP